MPRLGALALSASGALFIQRLPRGCFLRDRLGGRRRLHRRDLRIVFLRLLRLVLRHDPVGIFGLVRLSFGSSVSLTSAFCSASCGDAMRRVGVRSRRQLIVRDLWRSHLEGDLDAVGAEPLVALVAPQMGDRQRCAAEVQRQRSHGREIQIAAMAFARDRDQTSLSARQGFEGSAAGAPPARQERLRASPA